MSCVFIVHCVQGEYKKVTHFDCVDILAVHEIFSGNFTQLLNNKIYTLPPIYVWK